MKEERKEKILAILEERRGEAKGGNAEFHVSDLSGWGVARRMEMAAWKPPERQ